MQTKYMLRLVALLFVGAGVAQANLVYYLPFQDTSGNATFDNYGSADGTAIAYGVEPNPGQGSFTTLSAPTNGGAYARDLGNNPPSPYGRGPAIILPNSTANFRMTNVGDKMTIAAWLYLYDPTPVAPYYYRGIATTLRSDWTKGWTFMLYDNGTSNPQLLLRYVPAGLAWPNWIESAGRVTVSNWTHVAMTWEAGVADSWKVYVNGQGVSVDSSPATVVESWAGSMFAGQVDNWADSLNGRMDEFRMYDEILTPEQIAGLMIPEPASFGLLALAAFAGRCLLRRRS